MLVGIHRHPAIASTTAIYVLALAGYGLAADSPLAVPYLVQMVALSWLVLALDKRSPFSTVTLTGLSLWGLMHMVGGMVSIDGATLYETWLVSFLRWDQLVHVVGFGFGGIAAFEVFTPWLAKPVSPAAAAWTAFIGSAAIGAINETIEFIASRLLPFANVGDAINTGFDLIANAVGGACAAWWVHRSRQVEARVGRRVGEAPGGRGGRCRRSRTRPGCRSATASTAGSWVSPTIFTDICGSRPSEDLSGPQGDAHGAIVPHCLPGRQGRRSGHFSVVRSPSSRTRSVSVCAGGGGGRGRTRERRDSHSRASTRSTATAEPTA